MRRFNVLFLTLLVQLLLSVPAPAAASLHIRPALVAESLDPRPGGAVDVAIVLTPEPGWHGYWINPGDAGLPMDVQWTLPDGASMASLRYPPPQKLLIAGLMNHVFEGPYALLTRLSLPAGLAPGAPLTVRAKLRWLACTDRICVPEQADVSLDLTGGNGRIDGAQRARFDGYRAAMPKPLGSEATYQVTGNRIAFAIPYPAQAQLADPWLFMERARIVQAAAAQTARRNGDTLIVGAQLAPDASPGAGLLNAVLTVAPGQALQFAARPGPVPMGGDPVGGAPSTGMMPFVLALAGAVLGGLILNIMPCVFPILSLKAMALARAGGDEREARAEAVAYSAGLILSCLGLGALMLALRAAGQNVGWAFQLQDPRMVAMLLVLVTAITLNLAGQFELPALDAGRQGSGARGAFLTGVLAAFVATPCTGPFMAGAMGAALILPWPLALAVFAGLGLGLALPFVLLAFVPALRSRLPGPGPWMGKVRRFMAVPMALTAMALAWVLWRQGGQAGLVLAAMLTILTVAIGWRAGQRQRAGLAAGQALGIGALALLLAPVSLPRAWLTPPVQNAERDVLPFSEARLERLRREGQPVFLYFTADWCVTCKVNEAGAIADASVQAHFRKSGIAVMVGDWTNGDPAITRFLEFHGRSGVPLYLHYTPGAAQPRILPQVLTPSLLRALPGR